MPTMPWRVRADTLAVLGALRDPRDSINDVIDKILIYNGFMTPEGFLAEWIAELVRKGDVKEAIKRGGHLYEPSEGSR